MSTTPLKISDCEELNRQFNEALNNAPAWLLDGIIRDVCVWFREAIPLIIDDLLTTEDRVAAKPDDDDLDSKPESESKPESKSEVDEQAGPESETSEQKQKQEQEREREPENEIRKVVAPNSPMRAPSRKRYRPRWARCANCEEEYDVTLNDGESCYYHPESPEPYEDAFADHDEDVHGDINTKEMWDRYPDEFYYPCCDQKYGSDRVCKVGWHEEDTSGRKRRKYLVSVTRYGAG